MEKDLDTLCLDLTLDQLNRSVLNLFPTSIGIYDNEGFLICWNENFEKTLGVSYECLKNLDINIYNSPGTPQEIVEAFRQGVDIDTYAEYDFCKNYIRSKGKPIINTIGEREGYIFILDDITDKINNEEALQNSRCKIDMAMKVADVVLWEYDVDSSCFFSENEPLNGYNNAKSLTMDDYIRASHPEDAWLLEDAAIKMSKGEDFSFEFDIRANLDGTSGLQLCSVNGYPYKYDNNGKVTRYVGTRKNNTEIYRKKKLQDKILNSVPLSIHIKDVEDNFRYVFCNDESKKMFGTSEDKTASDIMEEEYAEHLRKTDLEVFNTGNPYLGVEKIVLKDGRSYETIVQKSIIEDNGKRLLLNIRWDQSLQNELKRSEKLLSMTLEAMNSFTWFFEPDKERLNLGEDFYKIGGKILDVNSTDKFISFVHPDDRADFEKSLRTFVDSGEGIWEIEYRFDLKGDGNFQWWETRGVLENTVLNDKPYRYMFGMTLCIDGHKQTELTLRKNKERLDKVIYQNELILNNTSSGLAYIGTDYIVQWENVSICSKSLSYEAYKKGELCYKSTHNRTEPCEDCVLQRAIKSRETEKISFVLGNKNTVEIFATPVLLKDGSVDGVVIRIDDITEREKMIEELRQAKKLAEESDKLKSAFLANMSHEIRTPLNAIVGFSDLLTTCSEDEEQEYINIIKTNNELLLKLINDILDLSKIEAGSIEFKYEEFDLSEYFNGWVTSMKQRITNPEIEFRAINPYGKCFVKLDYNRVAQILTNYATNAIKYTPNGFIEMGYKQKDNGIYFFVKDSGIGISEDKKNKVFHRFEKLDEFAQGTGLGLSICKAIAENMGGSVGFESTYGEGSTFWAFLPCECRIEENRKTERVDEVINEDYRKEHGEYKKTILVAEDILSNYMLLSAILRNEYNLIHVKNGQEAIDEVRNNGTNIDMILMDMKMPIVNGLKATEEIRKFNKHIPIVALTAHAFDSDRSEALKTGCNQYLVKPINKTELI